MTDAPPPWEPPLSGSESEQILGALGRLRTMGWNGDNWEYASAAADARKRLYAVDGLTCEEPTNGRRP